MKTLQSFLSECAENPGPVEFLSEAVTSPVLARHPLVQKFEKERSRMGPDERVDALKEIYSSLLKVFEKVKARLQQFINKVVKMKGKASNKIKILIGIKPFQSVISKIIDRKKPMDQIGDLVRCAVLFPDQESVDNFVSALRRRHGSMIKDYETKDKGKGGDAGYYGSHHFDLMIEGLVCEMQVMTTKLWSYKDEGHKIYNKYRDTGGNLSRQDSRLSKKIFALGNRPRFAKEEVELLENSEVERVWLVC